MSESLIITWNSNALCLYLLPNKGIWVSNISPHKQVKLHRPTRIKRIVPSTKQELANALKELFNDIDLNFPVWFLLPHEWVPCFRAQSPEFMTPKQNRNHLLWETHQRLRGNISTYRVLLPAEVEKGSIQIQTFRGELADFVSGATDAIDLKLGGIGVEPIEDESYSFDSSQDLREAVSIELEEISLSATERKPLLFKIGIGLASFIFVLIVIISIISSLGKDKIQNDKNKSDYAVAIKKTQPEKTPQSTELPSSIKEEKIYTPATSSTSPFGMLIRSLPHGAAIKMAVVSPVDMRVEVTGLNNADQWLNGLRSSNALARARIAGRYNENEKEITVLQLTETNLKVKTTTKNAQSWRKRATAAGLSVKDQPESDDLDKVREQYAYGHYNSAVGFIESLWKDMNGYSKIYFAKDKDKWIVMVQ